MAQIFFCDMKKFEHLYEECISLLPPERRRKAERKINRNDALLSATSGLMLKKVLEINKDGMLIFNEHGKPFLEHGPFFSISHSRRFSVLAVSNEKIGIDIEMNREINYGITERCFTEDERTYAEKDEESFLRIWTAKEAVLKLLGTGFSLSPKSFSVFPLSEKHAVKDTEIKFFCTDLKGAPLTAAYCGDEDFEIREFLPEDLIY